MYALIRNVAGRNGVAGCINQHPATNAIPLQLRKCTRSPSGRRRAHLLPLEEQLEPAEEYHGVLLALGEHHHRPGAEVRLDREEPLPLLVVEPRRRRRGRGGARDSLVTAPSVAEKLDGTPTLLAPGRRLRESSSDDAEGRAGSRIARRRTLSPAGLGRAPGRGTPWTGTPSMR